jgi:hypothetical protein
VFAEQEDASYTMRMGGFDADDLQHVKRSTSMMWDKTGQQWILYDIAAASRARQALLRLGFKVVRHEYQGERDRVVTPIRRRRA